MEKHLSALSWFIESLEALGNQSLNQIDHVQGLEELEALRVSVLGKKGTLAFLLKKLGQGDPSDRPKMGACANLWKKKIETALQTKKEALTLEALNQKLKTERLDVTLPERMPHQGKLHPITEVTQRCIDIFNRLGFDLVLGPEIETEYFNFEAVNIPPHHPAREMQDTFFLEPGLLLRTHTSSVQMRTMQAESWPLRILSPGAVYRRDQDATHSPLFHQIEGLWVDLHVQMQDLKGCLEFWAKELFGKKTKIRLRPSYFPFVEPGAEIDVSCFRCAHRPLSTCRICQGSGWLEILGAGMIHPKLFEHAQFKYIPASLRGFAFGMGIERIAMILYEIPDLRLLFQGDIRFLSQF